MFKEVNGELVGFFEFKNFELALSFVNKVGALSELMDHHPDILLYQYNKVKISMYTHTENKITKKDTDMGKEITKIFENEF